MSSNSNGDENSQQNFEQGLEGEYDSENPPEGYESWAEWYYYNGESDTDNSDNDFDDSVSDETLYEQEENRRMQDEAYQRLVKRAKEEGVHPDMYYRTDGNYPKWIQDINTWFYTHPVIYKITRIALILGLVLVCILLFLLQCT